MEAGMMLCMRCEGRKRIYKVGSVYSFTNTGGSLVDCPMCLAVGKVKKIENLSSDELSELSKSLNHEKHFKEEIREVKLNPKSPEIAETLIKPSVQESELKVKADKDSVKKGAENGSKKQSRTARK